MFSTEKAAYIGFDPTAESIHLGNLVGYLALFKFRAAGYHPIVLFGGATGLIGDPSGRSSERNMLTMDEVCHNVSKFEAQFRRLDGVLTDAYFTDSETTHRELKPITYVNNIEFYKEMNALCFLREIGKHFRVSQMLARDSVKSRIQTNDNSGISYTEFSYQMLQANDFYRLSLPREQGGFSCALQIGGSDQWGNIVAGIDYIRRKTGQEAFGLTIPLLCSSKGEKYGKSTGGGSLWLDP